MPSWTNPIRMGLGPARSTRALPGRSGIIATGGSCRSCWFTTSTMNPVFRWSALKTAYLIWSLMGKHASARNSWPLRESNNSSSFGFWPPPRIETMMARIGSGARSRQGPRQEPGQAGQVYRAPTKKEPSSPRERCTARSGCATKNERWRAPDRVGTSSARRYRSLPPCVALLSGITFSPGRTFAPRGARGVLPCTNHESPSTAKRDSSLRSE